MPTRTFEGNAPRIARDAYVDSAATVIGDVVLGTRSSVWPTAVLRGDVESIRVGARTNVQDGAVVHVTHDSEFSPGGHAAAIGDDVTIGHRAVVHACTIADRVLVGMGAIVLDGAVVRRDVMLGAGALVPAGADLASGWLYLGSPAKPRRELTADEFRFLEYSAEHYARLAARHAAAVGQESSHEHE